MHNKRGRPRLIDEESEANLADKLVKRHLEQNCVTNREFGVMMCEEMENTKRRRGLAAISSPPCRNTVNQLKKRLLITTKQSQAKPSVRISAEYDPRNAYTMSCMVHAFCEGHPSHLTMNWDATQFVFERTEGTTVLTIKREETIDVPATVPSSSQLGYAIKLYHLHNAAGNVAPPIFVVADDSMGPDDFFQSKIIGLSNNNAPNAFGYLCFTQTRCCNPAFYRWFVKEIVCKFVGEVREANEYVVSEYFILSVTNRLH